MSRKNTWQRLAESLSLQKYPSWMRELGLLAALLAMWAYAVTLRPHLLALTCLKSGCKKETIFALDRFAVDMNLPFADQLSEIGELLAITLSTLTLLVISFKLHRKLSVKFAQSLRDFSRKFLFVIEVIAFNGLLTELARLLIQRPRPFVYRSPEVFGSNPAHYVSFYSGHTSFVAAVAMATFLVTSRNKISKASRSILIVLFSLITLMTATCRVLAGLHFPTDVLTAILAGAIAAILVFLLHRNSSSLQLTSGS